MIYLGARQLRASECGQVRPLHTLFRGYTTSRSHYVHRCHCHSCSPPRLCWVWSLPSAWELLWAEAVFHLSQCLKASTKPINSRLPRVICETVLRLLSETPTILWRIKQSRVSFTSDNREVPQKWGTWKSHQIPSLLLSFWVNFPPFIYVAPLKSVSCLINPALMGSFSDPTFTLQVSFLDIQGPYSYLVTTGARISFFFVHGSQRSPGQARASSPCWEALGTPGHCAPATPPPALTKTLPSTLFGTKLRQPSGTWGSCKVPGRGSAFGQPAPERAGVGGWGNPWGAVEDVSGLDGHSLPARSLSPRTT